MDNCLEKYFNQKIVWNTNISLIDCEMKKKVFIYLVKFALIDKLYSYFFCNLALFKYFFKMKNK